MYHSIFKDKPVMIMSDNLLTHVVSMMSDRTHRDAVGFDYERCIRCRLAACRLDLDNGSEHLPQLVAWKHKGINVFVHDRHDPERQYIIQLFSYVRHGRRMLTFSFTMNTTYRDVYFTDFSSMFRADEWQNCLEHYYHKGDTKWVLERRHAIYSPRASASQLKCYRISLDPDDVFVTSDVGVIV